MFAEILQEVVDKTEGGIGGVLMGYDGIAIDQYVREDAISVETVGMEFSVILKNIMNAAELLDAGTAREVAVKAEKLITVVRLLNEEFFIAMTLRADGNIGKARYLLRLNEPKLLSELT